MRFGNNDEPKCGDDDIDCWKGWFKAHRPCRKNDADCWVSFFTKVAGLEPKMKKNGKLLGLWG